MATIVQVRPRDTSVRFSANGALAVAGTRLVVGTTLGIRSLDVATGAIDPAWGGSVDSASIIDIAIGQTSVFVGGLFTHFMGAARSNLAALDLATGALTPWNPPPSAAIRRMVGTLAVSPSGSLFAPILTGADFSVTQIIVEFDAAGAPTAWTSPVSGSVLEMSPAGTLIVGTRTLVLNGTPRASLAAFDLTTGALQPEAPVVNGLDVSGIAAIGQTMYLSGTFTSVNGAARTFGAAVDTATNTLLPWTLPAAERIAFAHGGRVYTVVATPNGAASLRRRDALTAAVDPAWQPPALRDVIPDGSALMAAAPLAGAFGVAVGVLDATTGQFSEAFRTLALDVPSALGSNAGTGTHVALDGDTVYLAGRLRGQNGVTDRDLADTVMAFDRRSGLPVGPSVRGYINGVTVADGRVMPFGGRLVMNGHERVEVAEVSNPAGFTTWSAGWPWRNAPLFFGDLNEANFVRGVSNASVAGNLLVLRGVATGLPGPERVTAFPLSGNSVPSRLRSQVVGPNTVFSWDPMTFPPAGGYVIEGGFAAGQTAGALAVGNATSVALPMPPGPAFIRVRPQASTDVSNEIVAGCFAPPLPPTALTTTLNGTNLSLAWTAPVGAVNAYTFLAGTSAGSSNAATLALPGTQTSIGGTVPGGTFFARVTATNACGTSGPSGEVFFTIGAPDALPAAPTNLAATVSGSTVSLTWAAPAGPVTGYVLEGGTSPGLANIGTIQLGAVTSFAIPGVPTGTYYLRARAITSAGSGAASNDVVVVVP